MGATREVRAGAGGALHVDVHDGDGPPALVVHGMMAGRTLWAANVDALCTVCSPVVVELYGHGRSGSPDDPAAYTVEAYASAFASLRVALGVARWSVIGHSLGAALALRYALDHPDEVLAQVLTNSASALAGPRWRAGMEAGLDDEAARIEAGGRAGLAEHRINPVRVRRIVARVRDALAADAHLLDPVGLARTMRHTTPGTSLRERLMDNTRPMLLVSGDRERAFDDGREHAAQAPYVEVRRVDAGHSPNAEIPDVFNALVVDFLGMHARP